VPFVLLLLLLLLLLIFDRVNRTAVNGEGATHLCDVVACQLPEAGWWEQGGGSKNGRGLNRSNSSSRGLGRSRSMQESAAAAVEAADTLADVQADTIATPLSRM
jgi:hypothetical protein